MSDHQEQLHEELEQVRVALHQMASEARGCSPGTPSPRAPPTDRNVQVIVEIEARAATLDVLFHPPILPTVVPRLMVLSLLVTAGILVGAWFQSRRAKMSRRRSSACL